MMKNTISSIRKEESHMGPYLAATPLENTALHKEEQNDSLL